MNCFYVLKSMKDGNMYYELTSNLKNRLIEHENGKIKSTKPRLPMKLIYYEAYENLESARAQERQVKDSGSARISLSKRINMGQ